MTIPARTDVVVIGGGPSGSSAATMLASKGYEVVLLDRQSHPRATVGESLLPQAWRFFDLLGVTDAIADAGFVVKSGGTVIWNDEINQIAFRDFGYSRPGLHVERDRFDWLLLDHARRRNVQVFEQVAVREVDLDALSGPRVRYAGADTDTGEIRCRFVVDASGQSAVLSRQMGTRVIDEDFRFVAMWGYFDDSRYVAADGCAYPFERLREIPPTTLVTSLGDWGWSWHIPQRDATSVGLILPLDQFKAAKVASDRLEQYFLDTCAATPYLGRLLEQARYRQGSLGVIRDYSYVPTRIAGPGYFIVGDAAAFVDPIFSLGVVLGMYSGHAAAWAIDRSLRQPETTEHNQDIYSQQFTGRYEVARAMALPGRKPGDASLERARRFMAFQPSREQELTYTAALLTTRARNFQAVAGLDDAAVACWNKSRKLDAIRF